MRTAQLSVTEDDFGETGFKLKGVHMDENMNAAREGHLLAHDIIEHVNGPSRIGMIDDEMEALGALYACRGQYGWLRANDGGFHTIHESIASDISRMAVDIARGAEYYPTNYPKGRAHHLFEVDFDDVLRIARRQYKAEMKHYDEDDADHSLTHRYWEAGIYALRTGARKLVRKYRGAHVANNLFRNIERCIDKFMEYSELYEGTEYVLRYNTNGAWIDEVPDPYAY